MRATRKTFLPFSPPRIGEEEIAEVVDTLRSDWITTGPKVTRFEQAFIAGVGAPSALALSSCTAALHVALTSLGIGPGDCVITSPMTFCSTAHTIEHAGARPLLLDVERRLSCSISTRSATRWRRPAVMVSESKPSFLSTCMAIPATSMDWRTLPANTDARWLKMLPMPSRHDTKEKRSDPLPTSFPFLC